MSTRKKTFLVTGSSSGIGAFSSVGRAAGSLTTGNSGNLAPAEHGHYKHRKLRKISRAPAHTGTASQAVAAEADSASLRSAKA